MCVRAIVVVGLIDKRFFMLLCHSKTSRLDSAFFFLSFLFLTLQRDIEDTEIQDPSAENPGASVKGSLSLV